MNLFVQSFCATLLHSCWQAGLIMLLYILVKPLLKKQAPDFNRNMLFGFLTMQLIISVLTFFVLYNKDLIATSGFAGNKLFFAFSDYSYTSQVSDYVFTIYWLIVSYKVGQLFLNWYYFKKMSSTALHKSPVELRLFTNKKANELGIKRKVHLWFSNNIATPLTFGFFRPVILMPVALINQLNIEDTEALIIHELTHIRNNDYLLNWFLVVMETIYFFNPFIRLFAGKIKLEREKNCDVQVMQYQYSPIAYAETLLKAAQYKKGFNLFQLAAAFKNRQLLQRIHFFTTADNLQFRKKKTGTLSFFILIVLLITNFFFFSKVNTIKDNSTPVVAAPFTISNVVTPVSVSPAALHEKNLNDFVVAQVPVKEKSLDLQVKEMAEEIEKSAQELKNMEELKRAAEELMKANLEKQFNAIPAAHIETDDQELIIQEQSSGSNELTTKSYSIKLENGKWKKQLLYILKDKAPLKDSIRIETDSAVIYIPPMQ